MPANSLSAFAVLRPLLSLAGMARSYRGSVQLGEDSRRSAVPGAISSWDFAVSRPQLSLARWGTLLQACSGR